LPEVWWLLFLEHIVGVQLLFYYVMCMNTTAMQLTTVAIHAMQICCTVAQTYRPMTSRSSLRDGRDSAQ